MQIRASNSCIRLAAMLTVPLLVIRSCPAGVEQGVISVRLIDCCQTSASSRLGSPCVWPRPPDCAVAAQGRACAYLDARHMPTAALPNAHPAPASPGRQLERARSRPWAWESVAERRVARAWGAAPVVLCCVGGSPPPAGPAIAICHPRAVVIATVTILHNPISHERCVRICTGLMPRPQQHAPGSSFFDSLPSILT